MSFFVSSGDAGLRAEYPSASPNVISVGGGTSASSPMIAARSAVAGVVVNGTYVYGSSITFRDIVAGNNGAPALVGYDLVTGRGSWTN